MNATIPETISPAKFAQIAGRGNWKRTRHLDLLNRELMQLASAAAAGRPYNLGVFLAPRHGKTRLLTEIFAGWYLGTFPTRKVIIASHSATLASTFGMNVRDLMEEFGGPIFGVEVRNDRRAIDNWGLTDGGGLLSIGVGGSLVGHGADLFIFDDIIADAASALSETVRNSTMDWYESTAETRVNAGGSQIFTMQRWHADDPAQRVVFDHPERWSGANGRTLNLPAIAEEDDLLGRKPGEALWPEKWPIEYLEELQARKPFWFAAQYQQRPVPRGGGMFQAKWFTDNIVRYRPSDAERIRWWDRAASDGKGDFTAGVMMSRKGDIYYIEHVERGQWATTERDRVIRAKGKEDNDRHPNAITTWGEQEPGSSGKDAALAFERMLAPYAAHCEQSTGSKVVRADGFAGACGRGEVRMVEGDWNDAFVQELSTFPFGKKDDQVDAASGAYNKLALADGGRESAIYDPANDLFAEYEGVTF